MVASRRGFISTIMALIPGVVLASPKRLQAAKPEIKDLICQIELQILKSSRPKKNPSVMCRSIGDTSTLYREKRGKRDPVCSLNPTGKMIWEECDGKKSPSDISKLIHERYQVSKHQAAVDTLALVRGLRKVEAIL